MPLLFKFDADQEHQIAAIEAIAGVFQGQRLIDGAAPLGIGMLNVIPNRLDLDDEAILENAQRVQRENKLPPDESLSKIGGQIETDSGIMQAAFPNFSIEMETGTGKTYVYLRTILELKQRYGLSKFIIVVPSIAVREGVIATVDALRGHFSDIYDSLPYDFTEYDSSKISVIRQFAASSNLSILLMTVDSFNKSVNIIKQRTDKLQGEIPLHLLQRCSPIIIMDEPQNMESELSVASIAALNPLCTLRYSATHRNPYNLLYRLTPYEAYRLGLVKRVEVAGIEAEHGEQLPFIRVESIRARQRSVTASVRIFKTNARGEVNDTRVTLHPNDDLQTISGLEIYKEYIVEEISANQQAVVFGNQCRVSLGESFGSPTAAIIEAQIRYTIEEHFRKAGRLREKGIKVLSLFFIPTVADYVGNDGFVRSTFDKAFKEIAKRYPEWAGIDPATVRAAYFATHRRRGSDVAEDTSGKTEHDRHAYNLIMRNKATLASLDEPVCFIFSHTALREGWDSPNVFQICTLNRTHSNLKKRQEVGRGVRLAVNGTGDRVHDERVNVLTVICNENYERFVKALQDETVAEFGVGNQGPTPGDARRRATSRLHKGILMNPEFLELWNKIRPKTRYNVKIDSTQLVHDTVTTFATKSIAQPRIKVDRAEVIVTEKEDQYIGSATSLGKTLGTFVSDQHIPNVIDLVLNLLERTAPPIRVTRKTVFDIYKASGRSKEAASNPQLFAEELVGVLRDKLIDQMINGIKYLPIGESYIASQFDEEVDSWESSLIPVKRSVYDYVVTQSDPEREFAIGLDARDDIRLFVKLPAWFAVDTPLGKYNPDWAIIKEPRDAFGNPEGDILYLVRETKGSADPLSLRKAEYLKTLCGKAHFIGALKVDYAVVSSSNEV